MRTAKIRLSTTNVSGAVGPPRTTRSQRPGQVHLIVGGCGRHRSPHDREPRLLALRQDGRDPRHLGHWKMFQRTGRGLHRGGRYRRCVLLGDDQTISARTFSTASDSTQVVRVRNAVQDHQQRRGRGSRGSGQECGQRDRVAHGTQSDHALSIVAGHAKIALELCELPAVHGGTGHFGAVGSRTDPVQRRVICSIAQEDLLEWEIGLQRFGNGPASNNVASGIDTVAHDCSDRISDRCCPKAATSA